MVNQFEVHPLHPSTALRQLCASRGIAVVAYASLGCGALLKHPAVVELARQAGKQPAQVGLLLAPEAFMTQSQTSRLACFCGTAPWGCLG